MNSEDRAYHAKYEALSKAERECIDAAHTAARHELEAMCKPGNLDTAEALVAAMTKYYLSSERS